MKKALNWVWLAIRVVGVAFIAYGGYVLFLRFFRESPPRIVIEPAPGGGEKPAKKKPVKISNKDLQREREKLKCGK